MLDDAVAGGVIDNTDSIVSGVWGDTSLARRFLFC